MDSSGRNSLLVVDDDTSNLLELTHVLGSEYEIFTAKSGATALKIAERSLPDLILLDVIMPDMSGFEVLANLKGADSTKAIPVIFITGINERSSESEGLDKGAVDFIRKPFDDKVVKLRVRHQIQIINLRRNMEHATHAAEMANQAKTAFLANMSHEIRTPMNAILGVTEILMQREKLPSDIEEGLGRIYNSCDLLLGIINDILDLSKIEAGKMDIMTARYKVASMINDSVQLNMMRINSKPIVFTVNVDENIPAELIGDELRIKQILNNLLSNAFKYTEAGEVTLSVASEPLPEQDGVMLVLKVQDTGHGMTKKQLDRLFDEYSRFNQQRNSFVEGTGLGLAITRSLLGLMNGEIHVESWPDKGSLFTVRLPQGKTADNVLGSEVAESLQKYYNNYTANEKKKQIIRHAMPYGKVLIVDDVETNLYVAMGLMKPYMLQIDIAMSGGEAIAKINDGKEYDIVFMDHMMPEMDGIETTKRLRDSGYISPIVALTANAVAGQADMFLQNGFDAFISKPIDIRQLNSILNKMIRDSEKYKPEAAKASRLQKDGVEINDDNGAQSQVNPLVLEAFIRDAQKAIVLLEELEQKADWIDNEENTRKFTVAVHGIKNALANIGEQELSKLAYDLEQAGHNREIGIIKASAPDLLGGLRALLEALESTQSEDGVDDDDIEGLRAKMASIQEMCADYNRKGALDILTEIKCSSENNKTLLNKIKDLVLYSEFEKAESAAAEFAANLSAADKEIANSVQSGALFLGREIDGLNLAKGLERYDGDEEVFIRVLHSYEVCVRGILGEMESVSEDNLPGYKIKAHSIKGVSYDVFAEQIGNTAAELEKAAAARDISLIREKNPAFLEAAWKLVNDIGSFLSEFTSEDQKPTRDKPDDRLLAKLLKACENYDMDGADAAMAGLWAFQYENDDGLVTWLKENVEMLNFSQIVKKLS